MKVSFRSLSIFCTDLDRSFAFYKDLLGAEPLRSELARRWIRLGELEINLVPNASIPAGTTFPDNAMAVLWVEVDDLSGFVEDARQRKVECVDYVEGEFAFIADPDGLLIEVWQKEFDTP